MLGNRRKDSQKLGSVNFLLFVRANKPAVIKQSAKTQTEILKLKENPVPPMLGLLYIDENKSSTPKYNKLGWMFWFKSWLSFNFGMVCIDENVVFIIQRS